jgi:hypothetical protein
MEGGGQKYPEREAHIHSLLKIQSHDTASSSSVFITNILNIGESQSWYTIIIFILESRWILKTTMLIRMTNLFGPPKDSCSLGVFPPAWDKYCNQTLLPSWNPAELTRWSSCHW